MLMQLRKKGPSTEGVFRKTCNNKNMRDVREQLNSGLEVDLEAQPVLLLVGLLKVGFARAGVVRCRSEEVLWFQRSLLRRRVSILSQLI